MLRIRLHRCCEDGEAEDPQEARNLDRHRVVKAIQPELEPPTDQRLRLYQQSARKGPPDATGCLSGNATDDACVVVFTTDPAPATRGAVVVTISPYQAALMAVAYLPLQPGKPTVGPPPKLNKWKMAAVGYPLWIWAEGNLTPRRSPTQSAASASPLMPAWPRSSTTWATARRSPAARAPRGARDAFRGNAFARLRTHLQQAISAQGQLPDHGNDALVGRLSAGGQSGTIPFTQTSSTTLPVGEVQTLVR